MDGVAGDPQSKKKRAFLRWHRRAGKDLTCFSYLAKETYARRGSYYYFLPNYAQGRKIIWEGMDREGNKFLDRIPKELVKRIQSQEMIMELHNGSILRIIGTDNIDSIVGTNPIGCVFSEYALQDPKAWEFIRPILAENGGWAIFNGTPRGRNHMFDLEQKIRGHKDWYFSEVQTLWPERPNYTGVVSPDIIDGERESGMDEDTVEQEFGVSYSAGVKGAFYSEQIERARSDERLGSYVYDNQRTVDTFWDLGMGDDTCVWFRQLVGNKRIWIDFLQNRGKDIGYYVSALADKGYKYRTHYLPHDGGSRTIQTNYRTDDLFRILCKDHRISDDIVVCPRLKVKDGIAAVRANFGKYYFNTDSPDVREGIKMLELYHRRWDSKRKTFMKEPVHDWTSHCADALRTEASSEEIDNEHDLIRPDTPQVVSDYNIFTHSL
jgi:hypothetical protein